MRQLLRQLVKLLPLIIIFQWDLSPSGDPNIIVQGFRIKASPVIGGPYTTIIDTSDPSSRNTTEGTLTSGQLRCYIAMTYGTVGGGISESTPSAEICITNTIDPPLVGPGSSKPGQVIYR